MKTIQGNTAYIILLMPLLSFCLVANHNKKPLLHSTSCMEIPAGSAFKMVYGLAISDFTLIDATTNKDLFILKEGGIINIDKVAAAPLNIRANEIDSQSGITVAFDLTGPVTYTNTERKAPYALFGDAQGHYEGMILPAGTYHLKASASVTDYDGNSIFINEISLNFIVGMEANEIIGFNLVDAAFDTDLDLPGREYHIKDGQVFDIDNYPFYINGGREASIKASTNSYETGSVAFLLKGPITYSRIENKEPFTLFGDQAPDFYGKVLPAGAYTLTATPYSAPNKQGLKGISKVLHFSLLDLPEIAIQEFAGFIQANTDLEALYLNPYKLNVIHQNEIPTNEVNIAVYPSFPDNGLASVFLELHGPFTFSRTENLAPYALFGDINGNYHGMNLPPGQYKLHATPYTGPNGQGQAGLGYSYDFEIIGAPQDMILAAQADISPAIILWPNPVSDTSSVYVGNKSGSYQVDLYDFGGRKIGEFTVAENETSTIDVSHLQTGYYFMRFWNQETVFTEILIVR